MVRNAQIVFEKGKIRAKLEMVDGTTEDYNYNLDATAIIAKNSSCARA